MEEINGGNNSAFDHFSYLWSHSYQSKYPGKERNYRQSISLLFLSWTSGDVAL